MAVGTHVEVPQFVRIVRPRHAFEGQDLEVFSHTTREGRLILILILPDGSRSMIPAAWTDWPGSNASSSVPRLRSVENGLESRSRIRTL